MGEESAVRRPQQGLGDVGLALEDVESGGSDLTAGERRRERLGVDEGAAGGVDQDRLWLHRRELVSGDRPRGVAAAGEVKADDVGAGEQLGELDPVGVEVGFDLGRRAAAGVEELARERTHQLRVAPPDSAHSDDPEGGAAELDPEVAGGVEAGPASTPQPRLGGPGLPRRYEGQGQRQLGGGIGQDSRGVGDGDPAVAAGVEVDVVVADPEVGDEAQLRPGGVEQLLPDRDGRVGDDNVDAVGKLGYFLRTAIEPAFADLGACRYPLATRVGDAAGDENARGQARSRITIGISRSVLAWYSS